MMDEVGYVSGQTRLFGIVGHPIAQVRSPEMVTAELVGRGLNAVLVPLHVLPQDFEPCLRSLKRLQNLDGLIFTTPFKQTALALADELTVQAREVGAINALACREDGTWIGDIFDGLGCVEAFRRRDYPLAGRAIMLIGAGGAGRAIAIAIAHVGPRALRIFDIEPERARRLADEVAAIDPTIEVSVGEPSVEGIDILLNASPVGMLSDPRMPIEATRLPAELIVFDAIVKPEPTKLLALARESGCRTVMGREMMRGQISKIVDFYQLQNGKRLTAG
jgi:shikimate dehydrogenase